MIARRIGGRIGRVINVDGDNQIGNVWRSYLRIKVELNWEEPLKGGLWIRNRIN